MAASSGESTVRLFYSYSHKDDAHREKMETALAWLRREGSLASWFDHKILPGQSISREIQQAMKSADILVFLISPDFIDSSECWKEWEYAQELASEMPVKVRIPVIVRHCAWYELLKEDDLKALPNDATPVTQYPDLDVAWHEVYLGIKAVVEQIRRNFSPREEFLDEIKPTEFISQDHISIEELYEFPYLSRYDVTDASHSFRDNRIKQEKELLEFSHVLIHGQEKTGKTALARFLFLRQTERRDPVLYVDLGEGYRGRVDRYLHRNYVTQFNGDFSLWLSQQSKTLIVDNMTAAPRSLDFIESVTPLFERIIVTTSSDTYFSYFRDEMRLAGFEVLKIEPLNHEQQEQLIRNRLKLSRQEKLTDGFVDRVERDVNSIVISNKIVPRYPFYVLSILQAYEEYMPSNLSVTSYGHCYYMLIVASLIRAGISKTDDAVGSCFNFLEELAYGVYQHRNEINEGSFDFESFVEQYKVRFFISDSTINRLKDATYGMINKEGEFRSSYMYYYFLGKYLGDHNGEVQSIVEVLCEESHKEDNFLILLFTIHHARDSSIIDDILLKTLVAIEHVPKASLNRQETERFTNIVRELPETILSRNSVEEERRRARARYSDLDDQLPEPEAKEESIEEDSPSNDVYTVLKNNKIMGQVLRNHYGKLQKTKVEEIIGIVADSGLRLVSLIVGSEEDLTEQVAYIKERKEDWDTERVRRALEFISFVWTLVNLEMVVDAVNVPEIREAIEIVVSKEGTPAYDLIGYFSLLDSADSLGEKERDELERLWKKHEDLFIRRVLALRTQAYMNSHRSTASIEQSICSTMGIRYHARLTS